MHHFFASLFPYYEFLQMEVLKYFKGFCYIFANFFPQRLHQFTLTEMNVFHQALTALNITTKTNLVVLLTIRIYLFTSKAEYLLTRVIAISECVVTVCCLEKD